MIAVVLVIAVIFAAFWSPPEVDPGKLKAVNEKAQRQEKEDAKLYKQLLRTK